MSRFLKGALIGAALALAVIVTACVALSFQDAAERAKAGMQPRAEVRSKWDRIWTIPRPIDTRKLKGKVA